MVKGGSRLDPKSPVIGLLFGELLNNAISIVDATDAIFEIKDNNIHLVPQKIVKKVELWTAVYATHSLLGWYTFGIEINESHLSMHQSVSKSIFIFIDSILKCSFVPFVKIHYSFS